MDRTADCDQRMALHGPVNLNRTSTSCAREPCRAAQGRTLAGRAASGRIEPPEPANDSQVCYTACYTARREPPATIADLGWVRLTDVRASSQVEAFATYEVDGLLGDLPQSRQMFHVALHTVS
jgi:hypothetical protein